MCGSFVTQGTHGQRPQRTGGRAVAPRRQACGADVISTLFRWRGGAGLMPSVVSRRRHGPVRTGADLKHRVTWRDLQRAESWLACGAARVADLRCAD